MLRDSGPPLKPLLRFAEFAKLPEQQLDLLSGAMLISEVAYTELEPQAALQQLDELVTALRAELGMRSDGYLAEDEKWDGDRAEQVLLAMQKVLGDQAGFRGNQQEYYDPRNSFLPDVLRRRIGLPITLTLLYIEIGRRIGAPLVGVGLPAHFVARWPLAPAEENNLASDLFIDPFSGGILMNFSQCRRLVLRLMSASAVGPMVDARWFAAVGTRAFLTRMLLNLKYAYLQKGDTRHALEVAERLVMLRPELPDELRDRGILRLAAGETLMAAVDLAAYMQRVPDAPDVARLRRRLSDYGELRAKRN